MTDVYRTPDERFAGLPGYAFDPHYVEQDGLRMHYVDEGAGAPVLLLHGEPTWAYLYRKVIRRSPPWSRVLAPDYFGFGRSRQADRRRLVLVRPHFGSIARLVEELDLRDVTVVVQDWGGPIGLRLAMEQPERIARLVIMNTGIFAGRAPSETWLRFRALVRRVGGDLQPGSWFASLARPSSRTRSSPRYDAPFPTPESKTGVLDFPEHVPTEPEHPSARRCSRCARRSRAGTSPALVFFGDSDPIFSPRVAERLRRADPGRRARRSRSPAPATSCRRTRARRSAAASRPGSAPELLSA